MQDETRTLGQEDPQATYANFFQVGHNEYEFLLDFGQQFQSEDRPVLNERIVLNPTYAKALWEMLGRSISDFESEFGAIRKSHDPA